MRIYVAFYSRYGNVEAMAREVAAGVEEVEGAEALLRFVGDPCTPPEVIAADERWRQTHRRLMSEYAPANVHELAECDGACFGSPTRFANPAAPMRNFFDTMGGLWVSGALADKPAGVFTSTATMHGGQELTLLNMWPQLAHLGMVIVGLGYLDERVASTQSGGTPYGPSHIAGATSDRPLDDDEAALCRFLGRRVARLAGKLAG